MAPVKSLAIGADETASAGSASVLSNAERRGAAPALLRPPSADRTSASFQPLRDRPGKLFAGHAAACRGAEHQIELVGDCRDFSRGRAFPTDEARRRAPQRRLRIGDAVCHFALKTGKPASAARCGCAGRSTESRVVCVSRQRNNGRLPSGRSVRMLSVSSMRSTSNGDGLTGTSTKSATARQSSVVLERKPGVSMMTGPVPAASRRAFFRGFFRRVLEDGDAAKRAFARGEPHDGALRIGVDQSRPPAAQMPMDRKATRQRALAAAAFHGGYRDDHARHLHGPRK